MTLLARKRVLACKTETTVGTAISLAGADAVFNVFDATIQPTIEFVSRMGQAAFGSITGSVGQASGTLTFRTELFGDGAAGVPSWASTLLPACGFVNSAGTFSPKSEAPGSNVKTLTMGLYEDGIFKSIRGAVGNCVVTIVPGKPVDLNWTFTGAWVTPTDVAILAPTYPTLATNASNRCIGNAWGFCSVFLVNDNRLWQCHHAKNVRCFSQWNSPT
jgi:hypothetical protein